MRCFLRRVAGNWHASFGFLGVSYTHSLRTKVESEAEVRLGPIRDTLYRLENGTLTIPDTINAKRFIVSGGAITTTPEPQPVKVRLTVEKMASLYLDSLQSVEANTLTTLKIHLTHVRRILNSETPIESITLADIDHYAEVRLAEVHHGRSILGRTVKKELATFRGVSQWAYDHGHTPSQPTWILKSVQLPKNQSREQFRSFDQITTMIARGGLTELAEERLWETLYLSGPEVESLLEHVREHAVYPWVYPMVGFVALTGSRRSEMVRSRIDDWNLDTNIVHVREKKRDKSVDQTTRTIDVHSQLRTIMLAWFKVHPGGQHTFTEDGGQPFTLNKVTKAFKRTLADHPKWCKVRGFHTLRHSLASILASKGVDQRYIDKVMGHQTEEMRKRYQHLFPKGGTSAINSLLT